MKYIYTRHVVAIILFLSLSMYAMVLWATDGLTKLGPLDAVIGSVDEAHAYLTLTHDDILHAKNGSPPAAEDEKKTVPKEGEKTAK